MKIKIEINKRKMSPKELQSYLKTKATGGGITKNGRAYQRHPKHKKGKHQDETIH